LTGALERYAKRAERLPGVGRIAKRLVTSGSVARAPDAATALSVIGLSVALHAAGIVGWWILARAIGLEIDAASIAWVRSAAFVVTLIPLTVSGLGLREGAVVYLLSGLGVAPVDALSLSLLAFATTVVAVGMLGGVVEAFRLLTQRAAE
jgi:uncharacterized membrane protein YbhN (UPF0104 family)